MGTGKILLILAIICFVLSAFGINPIATVNLVALGLAFFAGSFVV